MVVGNGVPAAAPPDGNHADAEWGWTSDGELEGNLIVWTEGGRLAGLEYAVVADEYPNELPDVTHIREPVGRTECVLNDDSWDDAARHAATRAALALLAPAATAASTDIPWDRRDSWPPEVVEAAQRLDELVVRESAAAMVLGEVGDVRRFPSRHHFTTYTGTAPREYSSCGVDKHRLSRAGNRKLNHALHIIALSHKRYDERGGEYYARKLAAGKGKKGALRSLKRRLSDVVFRTLVDDRVASQAAARKGNRGRLQRPARLTEPRRSALQESHLPDPPMPTLRPPNQPCQPGQLTQRGAATCPRGSEGSRSSLAAPGGVDAALRTLMVRGRRPTKRRRRRPHTRR